MYTIGAGFKRKVSRLWEGKDCFIVAGYLILTGGILPGMTADVAGAVEPASIASAQAFVATSTPIAIAFMASILVLKITACVLGYLIVRLGHDTLIKGISGEIDFGFSGSGIKTKLKAGSPGALFVLMGAAIILWGLTVQKPMEIKMLPASPVAGIEEVRQESNPLHRTSVPD
ncbi:MAG: hypothetical protein KKE44_23695 [Proteobacteria bacterium]|nr:hypothetical protein [Pseudomonadota bacterium]MBU1585737.1 hypothetical protein [Pseudomonadota bacterium]MBU2454218.1 hypothetical protein [Pseudomonadota bacterium]MBU2629938.1 hypothetical protein [Pseudomonadota bacterium]